MADFNKALPFILQNEGGYANVAGDAGGETYRGISRVNYPQWRGWDTVDANKPLKWNQVIADDDLEASVAAFYKKNKWDDMKGDDIADDGVGVYLCDWHVTSGHAIKETQLLLGVTADGIVGPGTIGAINARGAGFLADLNVCRKLYYEKIGVGTNEKFLPEWLARAARMFKECTTLQG